MTAQAHLAEMYLAGWLVAAHNDYALHGLPHAFYLLTHPCGLYLKGEGPKDTDGSDEAVLRDLTDRAAEHKCVTERYCDRCGRTALMTEGVVPSQGRCACGGALLLSGPFITHAFSPASLEIDGRWPGKFTGWSPSREHVRAWKAGFPPKPAAVNELFEQLRKTVTGEPPKTAPESRYRWRYEVVNTLMHEASKEIVD